MNPKYSIIDSERERPIRIYGSGSSTVEQRGSFMIRRRGATTGEVKHVYRCAEHGDQDVMVSRSDVPDDVPCPVCGQSASWAGSRCGIGISAGDVTC